MRAQVAYHAKYKMKELNRDLRKPALTAEVCACSCVRARARTAYIRMEGIVLCRKDSKIQMKGKWDVETVGSMVEMIFPHFERRVHNSWLHEEKRESGSIDLYALIRSVLKRRGCVPIASDLNRFTIFVLRCKDFLSVFTKMARFTALHCTPLHSTPLTRQLFVSLDSLNSYCISQFVVRSTETPRSPFRPRCQRSTPRWEVPSGRIQQRWNWRVQSLSRQQLSEFFVRRSFDPSNDHHCTSVAARCRLTTHVSIIITTITCFYCASIFSHSLHPSLSLSASVSLSLSLSLSEALDCFLQHHLNSCTVAYS